MSRLIIFAGPNGSGKSTITRKIQETTNIGVYLNADDIEKEIKEKRRLNLVEYRTRATTEEFQSFISENTLLTKISEFYNISPSTFIKYFEIQNDVLLIDNSLSISSYLSMLIVDFLRFRFVKYAIAFSFETVMSHPSKLTLMTEAQKQGFEVILYFITTESPKINVNRVKNRVKQGGHNVDAEKIISRYERSLELLYDAIKLSDLAYLFDNSTDGVSEMPHFATIVNGKKLTLTTDEVPRWFKKYVLDKNK